MKRTPVDLNQQCRNTRRYSMTYWIGIDIAKHKHDCFILNHQGEVIRDSFSFFNNRSGFTQLYEILSSLDSTQEKRIGFESTSHYALNLKIFLDQMDFSYMEFNPFLVRQFSKASTLRKTKTDKVDARQIALYLSTLEYKPYPNKSYHIAHLKSLTRHREHLIKQRSLQLVRMTNMLDRIFPEFKPFFNDSLTSKTCLYILDHYLIPSKVMRMNQDSYHKMASTLRRTISYARFCELKRLAKETIGEEDPVLVFQLKQHLDEYRFLNTQIDEVEAFITQEFSCIDTHIHSIKGIGFFSAATIFSEFGSIERFTSANQLLAYAGLEPSRHQSGLNESVGYMVKHGSPYLRQALMNVSESSLIHNPVLYDFYLKKRKEGKHHRVALSHVAKKIVRIIYHLETHHCDFKLDKMS